jgi:hypothetical protein
VMERERTHYWKCIGAKYSSHYSPTCDLSA